MDMLHSTPSQKAAATYNAAADHFDAAPLGFWERHGRRTVEALVLRPGDRVLDAGCGTGASALPAAALVGSSGEVIGIDIADNMLDCASTKARVRGLKNVAFENRDMTASGFPDGHFDAVIAVFAVFFVPDIEAQIAECWRMVRPGGKLAVTVWGPGAFEPVGSILVEEVRRLLPDLPEAARPWERLTQSAALRDAMLEGGTSVPTVTPFPDRQPLGDAEDAWTIAMGSGFRAEIELLTPAQQQDVRLRVLDRVAALGSMELEFGALCAVARKPTR